MIKQVFYTGPLLLMLLASCLTSKKTTTRVTNANNTSTHINPDKLNTQKDLNLFFDAENARLLGENREALELYSEYLKHHPKNATAYYNIARLYFQKQEVAIAIKNAEKATQLDPENKYFQELYTQLLVYTNKTRKAESQYNTLISKNPGNEEYIYKKAMLHLKAKEYDKALAALNDLEKKVGFNEDIILQKKNIYQTQGKTDEAIAELKKLRESDPSSPQYVIMTIDVYETGNQKEKAKTVYDELERDFANDALAQVALAQYYLENKNEGQYHRFMQKVMKNKNLDAETKMALLEPSMQKLIYDTLSDADEIINLARIVADQYPDMKDAQSLYAEALYFGRRPDEALLEYENLLVHDKATFAVWNRIINIYLEKQAFDSVLWASERSLQYFPENAIPYFYIGFSHSRLNQFEKAIPSLNKALAFEPEDIYKSQIYATLGEVYNNLKKFTESDSCFEKAITVLPNDATTLNNYAYYLSLRKEKLDHAEKMSKRSLQLQPDSKMFLDTYGWILFQQKKYLEARMYIEKAIHAGGDDDGTIIEHLGDILFHLNEPEKAVEQWKEANKKGEKSPLLLKKIKEGKWYEE